MSRETHEYFLAIAPVGITKDMSKKYRKKHRLLNLSDTHKKLING